MPSIYAAALLICWIPTVQAADKENPFKNSKVGDWVEYKMTGPNMLGTTRMTVVAKDDNELTYEVVGKFSYNGQEMVAPIQTLKIDLKKSYDPVVAANEKATNTKVDKEGEGKEKLKVGGKEFDTTWTKLKTTTVVNDMTFVSNSQMWYSKDVPLSGLVRMDSTTSGLSTKLELVGSGTK